mmetsp:Transcript_11561/g.17600  ORF Transcript_11561/g.17600 Transcript_11561/m.17600 type:complete len:125 (-) Transcript_11561:308-682(-)
MTSNTTKCNMETRRPSRLCRNQKKKNNLKKTIVSPLVRLFRTISPDGRGSDGVRSKVSPIAEWELDSVCSDFTDLEYHYSFDSSTDMFDRNSGKQKKSDSTECPKLCLKQAPKVKLENNKPKLV